MAKKVDEHTEEIKHYLGVLGEDFQDKIKVIAEQYFDIKETLDSHTKTLNSHTEILDSHTRMLSSHTEILNSHTEMIGQLMTDVSEIKNDLKQKVSYIDFAKLEKRVVRLEMARA